MHLHFGRIGVRDLDVHKLSYTAMKILACHLASEDLFPETGIKSVVSKPRAVPRPKAVSECRIREGREERLISIYIIIQGFYDTSFLLTRKRRPLWRSSRLLLSPQACRPGHRQEQRET